jgi:hypothetical protein
MQIDGEGAWINERDTPDEYDAAGDSTAGDSTEIDSAIETNNGGSPPDDRATDANPAAAVPPLPPEWELGQVP